MGTFSTGMHSASLRLITKLGNPCVLTKVTKGQYNPSTGKTDQSEHNYPTFSAPVAKASETFGNLGINTNLRGFDDTTVIVPWIGQEIDESWLYDGQNITNISSVSSQGDIIIYTISVGEK